MNCHATHCSICRRKQDRTKSGMTAFLVTILIAQAVALAMGWIPE